jgi:hypothetical protein
MASAIICRDMKEHGLCLFDKRLHIPPRRLASHALNAGLADTSRILRSMRYDLNRFKTGPCRACDDLGANIVPDAPAKLSAIKNVFETEKNAVLVAATAKPYGFVSTKPRKEKVLNGRITVNPRLHVAALDGGIAAGLKSAWSWLARRFGAKSVILQSTNAVRDMSAFEREITHELDLVEKSFVIKP